MAAFGFCPIATRTVRMSVSVVPASVLTLAKRPFTTITPNRSFHSLDKNRGPQDCLPACLSAQDVTVAVSLIPCTEYHHLFTCKLGREPVWQHDSVVSGVWCLDGKLVSKN